MHKHEWEQWEQWDHTGTTIGDNSCIGDSACANYFGPMIGDNAFVGTCICANCGIAVEYGQCNESIEGSICNCLFTEYESSVVIEDEEPMGLSPDHH